MATGLVESWAGSMLDIGPIYPFVGTEKALLIVGLVLWVLWHVWQAWNESREYKREYKEEAKKYKEVYGRGKPDEGHTRRENPATPRPGVFRRSDRGKDVACRENAG